VTSVFTWGPPEVDKRVLDPSPLPIEERFLAFSHLASVLAATRLESVVFPISTLWTVAGTDFNLVVSILEPLQREMVADTNVREQGFHVMIEFQRITADAVCDWNTSIFVWETGMELSFTDFL
jgi:hypothetical protein